MEFLEVAKQRYSERAYADKPIEQEKLDMILEAGRIAPTAGNRQPQRFYMLKSEKALAKAKEVTPFTYGAPVMLLVCFDSNAVWPPPAKRTGANMIPASRMLP